MFRKLYICTLTLCRKERITDVNRNIAFLVYFYTPVGIEPLQRDRYKRNGHSIGDFSRVKNN